MRKKIKKILAIVISFIIVFSTLENGDISAATTLEISNPCISTDGIVTWDIVEFGSYFQNNAEEKEPIEWRVLEVNGNDAFLLADKALDNVSFNNTIGNSWAESNIRDWLNNSFVEQAFNETERNAIKDTIIENTEASDSPSGLEEVSYTEDMVFLLSLGDVTNEKYGFKNDITRQAEVSDYAVLQGVKRGDGRGFDIYCDWWLRTPSGGYYNLDTYYGAFITIIDHTGRSAGNSYWNPYNAVRPALHVDLSVIDLKKSRTISVLTENDDNIIVSGGDNSGGNALFDDSIVGEKAESNMDFKIGSKVDFTVPSGIPIIGNGKVKMDFGNIPVSFERENNSFKLGIGVSDVKKFDKEGWTTFKKFVETQKDEYRKGINSLLASKFGTVTMGMEVKPKISCYGYVEGTITSSGVESEAGKMVIEIKVKASQEWQTTVVVVPVVIKFSAEVGIKKTCSVGLDFNNSNVYVDDKLVLTLPKVKLSSGVGVSHIADISVYGSVENIITIENNTAYKVSTKKIESFDSTVIGTLNGEMGVSAKVLFASYEKPLVYGELEYYNSSIKQSSSIKTSKPNVLYSASPENKNVSEWKIDDTMPSVWRNNSVVLGKNGSGASDTKLKNGIYDDASPKIIKTANDTILLTYIDIEASRTGVNKYVAVYSIYDPETGKWSEPVTIDDDGTADFNVRAVCDANKVYFVWCNMNDTISEELLSEEDGMNMAMSHAEIEMVELDVMSGNTSKVMLTDNNVLDFNPDICLHDGTVYVTWCSNSESDFTLQSGDNIVHLGMVGTVYNELSRAVLTKPIRDLAVGILGDSVYSTFVTCSEDVNSLEILSTTESLIPIYSGTEIVSKPSFNKIRGKNVLLWFCQDEEESKLCSADGTDNFCYTLISGVAINDDYYVLNDDGFDMVICSSGMEDNNSDLCAYKIYDDSVSDVAYLFNREGKISAPTAVIIDDGYMCIYKNSIADISESTVDVSTDLCVSTIVSENNVMIEKVEYVDEKMIAGEETTVTAFIKNNGLELSDDTAAIEILCGKELIGSKIITGLKPGEDKEEHINVILPDDISENSSIVVRSTRDDTVTSSETFTIGHTDLSVFASVEDSSLNVTVENLSVYDTSAVLLIYDTNEEGELLEQYDLGELSGGNKVNKEYDVRLYSKNADSLMFVVKTDDEELFDFNNRASVYIGKNILKTLDHIEAVKEKTEYNVGDIVSLQDLAVYAVYTDGSNVQVSEYLTNIGDINANIEGIQNIEVTYEDVGLTAKVDIPVVVTKNNTLSDAGNNTNESDSENGEENDNTSGNSRGSNNASENSRGSDNASENSRGSDNVSENSRGSNNASENSRGSGNASENNRGSDDVSENSRGSDNASGSNNGSEIASGNSSVMDNSLGNNGDNDNSKGNASGNMPVTSEPSAGTTLSEQPIIAPVRVKITSAKNSRKKSLVVKWMKVKNAKGYEVSYAFNKKFTRSKKTKTISKTSYTTKKLKKGKIYYIRVRAYNQGIDGSKVYGKWSAVKKVKVKK